MSVSDNDRQTVREIVLQRLIPPRPSDPKTGKILPCDLTDLSISNVDLSHSEFFHVRFGAKSERHRIENVDFTGCTFEECDFEMCELVDCKFQDCRIIDCDFRYARFVTSSFARATISRSDLYRTVFEIGNIFEGAELTDVSLHLAELHGSDLRWSNFVGPLMAETPTLARMLQEHPEKQRGELEDQLARAIYDAIDTYRRLAGMWNGLGLYSDEARAYRYAKRLELKAASIALRRHSSEVPLSPASGQPSRRRALQIVVGHSIANALCGFGESLGRITLWILGVVLATGALFSIFNGVQHDNSSKASVAESFTYAVKNLVGGTATGLHLRTNWQLVGAAETIVALVLIGLFGFVLGNKLRRS